MTPLDLCLDQSALRRGRLLPLFRLANHRFADLSGIGASIIPGRWNHAGVEALYTSLDISTTVLERLAHSPKNEIPANLALMSLEVRGNWSSQGSALVDGETGACFYIYDNLRSANQDFQDRWKFGGGLQPFAVAVPSVIAPAWNVVLYPQATGFESHVSLHHTEPFHFDPRLFPDGTPFESGQPD